MAALTSKRRSTILDELRRNRSVRVADLSLHLGVSEVSIRRDLQIMEEQGLLKRVHGGAVSLENAAMNSALAPRLDAERERKERIGRAAAAMVARGESLIFDSGSTPLQVACFLDKDLLNSGNLTAVTAYLPVVRQLGQWPGVHLILLGGIYLPAYEVLVGPQTVEQLKGLHVDKMFLGTDGMTLSHGFTTANVLEAEVDRAMVRAATEVIVVSDSSKIGGIGLATIMPVGRIDKLITDTDAPPDFVAALREQGIEVILV
jgi:DeoR family transcriptional regulator of aga operon/DeoR family fructose operon transcriptional repressor